MARKAERLASTLADRMRQPPRRGPTALLSRRSPTLVLAGLLLSCSAQEPQPQLRPAAPPEVEYADCKAVRMPGPFCVLGPQRKLQLWVGAPPDAEIGILVDGRRLTAAAKSVRNGQRFSLILPYGTKRLQVLVPAGQASWSLPFAPEVPGTDLFGEVRGRLRHVHTDALNGRLASAWTALQTIQLPSRAAPAESRYELHYYRALLAEREGDYRSAMAEIQQAVEIGKRVEMERYGPMAEQKQGLLLIRVGRFGD